MNDTNDNAPKLVQLPAQKSEAAAAGDAIRREFDALVANQTTIAKLRRAAFMAYKAEGFSDQQALELCTK